MGNDCTSCNVCKNAEVQVDNSKEKGNETNISANPKKHNAATPNE